jgi:hypothetical protein
MGCVRVHERKLTASSGSSTAKRFFRVVNLQDAATGCLPFGMPLQKIIP